MHITRIQATCLLAVTLLSSSVVTVCCHQLDAPELECNFKDNSYKRANHNDGKLVVMSFNVQTFGPAKLRRHEERNDTNLTDGELDELRVQRLSMWDCFAQIVKQADVVMLQEVMVTQQRDMDLLKRLIDKTGFQYDLSEKAASNGWSKDNYVLLYNKNVAGENGCIVGRLYKTSDTQFERYPIVYDIYINTKKRGPKRGRNGAEIQNHFKLIGIHAAQAKGRTEKEIEALLKIAHQEGPNVIIMGDLNADCYYLGKATMEQIVDTHNNNHTESNLILLKPKDGADGHTNVRGKIKNERESKQSRRKQQHSNARRAPNNAKASKITNEGEKKRNYALTRKCLYDRAIVSQKLFPALHENTTETFYFNRAFGLGDEHSLMISDHFPIMISLNICRLGACLTPSQRVAVNRPGVCKTKPTNKRGRDRNEF